MEYIEIAHKSRLDCFRRKVHWRDHRLAKSKWRHQTTDNWGGLMFIDCFSNTVVAGDCFP
jgi:hypothetical protein